MSNKSTHNNNLPPPGSPKKTKAKDKELYRKASSRGGKKLKVKKMNNTTPTTTPISVSVSSPSDSDSDSSSTIIITSPFGTSLFREPEGYFIGAQQAQKKKKGGEEEEEEEEEQQRWAWYEVFAGGDRMISREEEEEEEEEEGKGDGDGDGKGSCCAKSGDGREEEGEGKEKGRGRRRRRGRGRGRRNIKLKMKLVGHDPLWVIILLSLFLSLFFSPPFSLLFFFSGARVPPLSWFVFYDLLFIFDFTFFFQQFLDTFLSSYERKGKGKEWDCLNLSSSFWLFQGEGAV